MWSTDWWFDRAGQIATLERAVSAAITASNEAPRPRPAPPPASPPADPPAAGAPAPEVSPVVPYRSVVLAPVAEDPEAMYLVAAAATLRARILELVAVEAPISLDDTSRRVGACWGIGRLTDRVRGRVRSQAEALAAAGRLKLHGDFLWGAATDPATSTLLRGPAEDGTVRDPESLALEEVALAAEWVLSRSLAVDEASLAREAARVFGLTRLGRKVDERMRAGIEVLCARGAARRDGDRVVWAR